MLSKILARKPTAIRHREFILLMALMISLVALSLDIILPALPDICIDLGPKHRNDVQLVVSVLIFGLALGQLAYGPVSDSIGRKPAIFAGTIIFSLGCLMSIFAAQFWVMLAGRLLQGLGAAGPRSVIVAVVRDQYEGRGMAQIMSAVMAVFIVVPAIAPALGQAILLVANWRLIFVVMMALALGSVTWFAIRQPETLPPERRIPFSAGRIVRASIEVCTHRTAIGYTIAAGLVMGLLLGYLNSAQQVFQDIYDLGRAFPLFMGVLALFVGGASFFNSRIVMRLGMRTLSRMAIRALIILTASYLVIVWLCGGSSPLWLLMLSFASVFFCLGILFGNLNAIAMQPLGHIAGVGSAVVGSLSNFISVPLGIVIGRSFDGTTLPLAWGFVILSVLSAIVMHWADKPSPAVSGGR